MSKITVRKVTDKSTLDKVFGIRQEVFVVGQQVPPAEEYDEFEETSIHFLALLDDVPAGTARWRFTDKGIKLERFAVLEEARGKGVGQALVKATLEDIAASEGTTGQCIYLHAQLHAVPLYAKFGFEKVGDIFSECDILHYKMERYL
ncbi:GNAT family N-acetyltransferase [Echinicola vietnamensis]|uniref:Putative acyltransferase n=1 Tax=Echinicola vietnamensis (strain DSM 17526 / LMG 23754 / KMM 6221) TaxID=926556 RepID=L0FTL5_ECHVK|nr:GNAT family N-acetyltransferase [Echinicola vietnamensis]AGA76637.1 putative acyltransferase [Echinicola vietnamensis DSM 17526]